MWYASPVNLKGDNEDTVIPTEWRSFIRKHDWDRLTACGLFPKEIKEVPVGIMRIQHRSEWNFDSFLINHKEFGPRSILGSPIFDLARLVYEKGGRWVENHCAETTWYKWFRHFDHVGYAIDWITGERISIQYSEKTIRRKVKKFVSVFESIRKDGYLGGDHGQACILLLERPYESLRFNILHDIPPYEIWSGHHRAGCLAVLGYDKVKVVILDKKLR